MRPKMCKPSPPYLQCLDSDTGASRAKVFPNRLSRVGSLVWALSLTRASLDAGEGPLRMTPIAPAPTLTRRRARILRALERIAEFL